MSEEIEGRISRKLSQEFSRTESRTLGALSKLDEFLLNQQITTHSETVPGTFRNTNVENQGTNEDDSQSDPHPEAGIFRGQTTQNFGPKDCRDKDSEPQISVRSPSTLITEAKFPRRLKLELTGFKTKSVWETSGLSYMLRKQTYRLEKVLGLFTQKH